MKDKWKDSVEERLARIEEDLDLCARGNLRPKEQSKPVTHTKECEAKMYDGEFCSCKKDKSTVDERLCYEPIYQGCCIVGKRCLTCGHEKYFPSKELGLFKHSKPVTEECVCHHPEVDGCVCKSDKPSECGCYPDANGNIVKCRKHKPNECLVCSDGKAYSIEFCPRCSRKLDKPSEFISLSDEQILENKVSEIMAKNDCCPRLHIVREIIDAIKKST